MSILTVENLKKHTSYGAVLSGVTFSAEEKGVYAILGKASSGKSTLCEVLAGASEIDGGKVYFKDVSLYPDTRESRRAKAKIGYMPSSVFFYPDMTVFEVLDFTGRLRKVSPDKRFRQIKEALELLALSSKSEALVKALTVSEKKRLALANALVGNPSLLLLDDPTSRVTAEDAELIRNVIAMLGEMKTVFLFTDKTSEASALAKHVGIIADGKIVLWSTLDDIKSKFSSNDNALLITFEAFSERTREGEEGEKI